MQIKIYYNKVDNKKIIHRFLNGNKKSFYGHKINISLRNIFLKQSRETEIFTIK